MNSNNYSTTEINQKLSNGYVGFSKEVKKAAKYVMDNPAEIPLHSIRTVASNAGVNPSTMVRLITILGFKRYDEFKTIYKKAASQMPVSNFTSHAKDLLNEKHKNPFLMQKQMYISLSLEPSMIRLIRPLTLQLIN